MWYQRKTLTADKADPGVFYLYHSGEGANLALMGLWQSRDGGANWRRVYGGEIAPSGNMAAKLRSVPGHAGHLFFTSAFSMPEIRACAAAPTGATWNVVEHVDHVDDIAFGKAAPGNPIPRSSFPVGFSGFTASGGRSTMRPAGSNWPNSRWAVWIR
jgi:hypothetical protein